MTDNRPTWAALIREERRVRGWSQKEMARRIADAATSLRVALPERESVIRRIKDWEAGRHRPKDPYPALYARALGMDEGDLFGERVALCANWAQTISTSGGVPAPPHSVQATDVTVIRDMLRALTASDRQFGGEYARGYATDYLWNAVVPRLHVHAEDPLRWELFTVATEFALRIASMQLDAGYLGMSRHLLGVGASMAQEVDDVTLTAWVLARQGEQEIHQGMLVRRRGEDDPMWRGHINRALAYTSGAAAMATHSPPAARSFILTKKALSLSLTGDRKATQRTLAEVWRVYERVGNAPEPPWMGIYGWGNLRHEEGRCYYNLGMGEQAVRAAEDSVNVRGDMRPRAFSLGVQAIGYTQTREIERACAITHDLIGLAAGLASVRVTIRLGEVLRALVPYRGVAAVQEVYEAATPVIQGSMGEDGRGVNGRS